MNLSPEWKLLLACARTNLAAEDGQRVREELIDANLDWDYFTKLSCDHGIAPLIYYSLRRSEALSLLPPPAAETLRKFYYGNAARNTLLYDELRGVLSAFKDNQIGVVALKGAAMAETVYPHKALRMMGDIDLLIKKEQLAEVETTLLGLGFEFKESLGTKQWLEQYFYNLAYEKPAIKIEIHWHIGPQNRLPLSMEPLWERAQTIQIAGVEAKVFSPADLIFHLCQHFWKHKLMGGIRPLCDIAESARYYGEQIDWAKLVAISCEWQIAQYVYLQLCLARELLAAPIPESCLRELEPRDFNPAILSWAKERLFTFRTSSPISPDFMQLFGRDPSYHEKSAVLRKLFAPTSISSQYGYPTAAKRIYLQYPRRIGELLRRYGPVMWQLARGDQKMRAAAKREKDQLQLSKWISSERQ